MKNLLALGAALAAGTTGQVLAQGGSGGPIILLNEIRIDQPGGDTDEYAEILSIPSSVSLDGYWLVSIGDGTGGSGVVETAVDLSGNVTGSDGLFLVGESSATLAVPDLVATLGYENSDNLTHLIVTDFTGAVNDDLDTTDDGTLDITPWTSVVDALSMIETTDGSGELVYGAALGFNEVGPDGTFVPGHVFRCLTSLSDWRIGLFDPAEGSDTPGDFNTNCNGTTDVFCDPGEPNEFSPTGGIMSLSGTTSLQVNDASLVCSDVPNNFGLFGQSDMVDAPMVSSIGGNICLSGNVQRLNQIVFPSMNVATLPLDFSDGALVESTTMAGVTVYYQYFHRDATTAGGGNYSNGLSVTWTL